MLANLKNLANLKKWIEGHFVAGAGAATAATVGILTAPKLVELLASAGITVTIDRSKFNTFVFVAIAWGLGSAWNWLKAKAVKKVDETNSSNPQ